MYTALKEYLLIAAAVVILGLSGYAYVTKERLDAARSEAQSAKADAKAYETYAAKAIEVDKKKEKRYGEVRTVLEVNREWADLPLPDDVAALLRHPSDATEAVP